MLYYNFVDEKVIILMQTICKITLPESGYLFLEIKY